MLNSKQPPRVNAIRPSQNVERHGTTRMQAGNGDFYRDTGAERLKGHSHVDTNWRLTSKDAEQWL